MGKLNAPAAAINEHWLRNATAIAEAADTLAVAAKEYARTVEFSDYADAEEEQRLARAHDELHRLLYPAEWQWHCEQVRADEWRTARAEARAEAAAEAGW